MEMPLTDDKRVRMTNFASARKLLDIAHAPLRHKGGGGGAHTIHIIIMQEWKCATNNRQFTSALKCCAYESGFN